MVRKLAAFALAVACAAAAANWPVIPVGGPLFTGETARKYLPATMPGGIAVFDADGDGLLDLFLPNGAPLPGGVKSGPSHRNRFFRGRPGLQFEDRTAAAGLAGSGYDFGAAAGDFDGDGRVDLLVCGLRGVTLYRNAGGSFVDVTATSGINNQGRWTVGAAWLDIDQDGDLDLFIVNYVQWDPAKEKSCVVEGRPDFCHPKFYAPQPNALFRNDGGGRFTDVSRESGIAAHPGKGMAAAVADFDGDGFSDIFVTNDRSFNFLFHNDGRGHFKEIAFEAGVAAPASGSPPSAMGTDAQDFDGDGRPDLIYTALRDETFPLYRNLGKEFNEVGSVTRLAVLTRPMAGWGVVFADLDNDGWKDIVSARGDVLSVTGAHGVQAKEPISWFRNGPGPRGREFSAEAFLGAPAALYRGIVAADLDHDGCLDLVATSLQEPARVFRNPCATGHHWLKVDVRVPGARVRLDTQWRHVTSAVGYSSSYVGPLHFGVGDKKRVEVEIRWPGGEVQRLADVGVDQTLVVTK